jgi:hypothetical protein
MSRSVLRAIIGAAVLALLAAFYLNGSRDVRRADAGIPERVTGALEAKREQADPARAEDVRTSAAESAGTPSPRRPSAEDLEYRRRVLEGLRAREQSKRSPTGAAETREVPAGDEPKRAVDRTGELAEEVRIMNREFLPLVGECIDQAHERNPRLRGMMAVSLKIATDAEFGAIFEDVQAAEGNELHDDELIECVRQSAFTLRLPAARLSGRDGLMLTVPHRIDAGSGD